MAKRQKESVEKAKADTKKAPKKETADALGIGHDGDAESECDGYQQY